MFNIYYINYAKAYEIAMLLDNKILEQITKEHNAEGGITGVAETGTGGMTEIPLVGRYYFFIYFCRHNSTYVSCRSSIR